LSNWRVFEELGSFARVRTVFELAVDYQMGVREFLAEKDGISRTN
jgi:hypothetical protein